MKNSLSFIFERVYFIYLKSYTLGELQISKFSKQSNTSQCRLFVEESAVSYSGNDGEQIKSVIDRGLKWMCDLSDKWLMSFNHD